MKTVEILDDTLKKYAENLETECHPYLDNFYYQLGCITASTNQLDKAYDCYKKLLAVREYQYNKDGKELIATLMNLMKISISQSIVRQEGGTEEAMKISERARDLVKHHINKIDNQLIMDQSNLSPKKKAKLEMDLKTY